MHDDNTTTLGTDPDETDDTLALSRNKEQDPASALDRGRSFDKYVILNLVGSGGMGVVYAAFDPSLDRKVALKVLRPDAAGRSAERRLLREAQAMARLQHPNVVAVHDVGNHKNQTYLAMEFVDGSDLRGWLRAADRSWRDVLDVFIAAGKGLAAAHDAGLVHRDFKPSNILVGADGRVRVSDFGLARIQDDRPIEDHETPLSEDERSEPFGVSPLETPITVDGSLLGTPAFMPPEFIDNRRATPLSDQFSFCVSLFVALYGTHPYGKPISVNDFAKRVRRGAIEIPDDTRGVPRRVHEAILRGLRADPDDRFAGMKELVDALSFDSRNRRRRLTVVAASLTTVLMSVVGLSMYLAERRQLCAGGHDLVANVWNNTRRAQIELSFEDAAAEFGAGAALKVGGILDSYTNRWLDVYAGSCEATRIHKEQSETLLDLQVACLGLRLREADALINLFKSADVELVTKSTEAALGLSSPESCADAAALLRRVPLPDQPEKRTRIADAEKQLAEIRAQYLTGAYQEVLESVQPIVADALDISYAPLVAEALQQQGAVEVELALGEEAEKTLRASIVAAERGGADEVAISAAGDLLWALGVELFRFEELDQVYAMAAAKLERIGGGGELEAELLQFMAGALLRAGRYDEALELQEKVVVIVRTEHGEDSFQVAMSLHALGNVLSAVGRYEEAIENFQKALVLKEKHFGDTHPSLAATYTSISQAENGLGRYQETLAAARSAVGITEKVFGSNHSRMATPLNNLASGLWGVGKLDEAVETYNRSVKLIRSTLGENHPQLMYTYLNLAALHQELGQKSEALKAAKDAERIAAATLGEQHPMYAYAANNLGMALMYAARPDEAVPYLEQALSIRSEVTTDPVTTAWTRFSLGRALWESGERESGHRQVISARDSLQDCGSSGIESLEAVNAWLKDH